MSQPTTTFRRLPALSASRLSQDLCLCALLVLAGAVCLPFDMQLASWPIETKFAVLMKKLVGLSETFAHGMGIGLILATIAVIHPASRRAIPRLATICIGAGLWANIAKLCISRSRPVNADLGAGVSDTFLSWFPLLNGSHAQQSFPSAHTAVAFGFAMALAWHCRRGRWWFLILAMLSGMQRIETGAHFASDVCWGAAIGVLVAISCIHLKPTAPVFERLESFLGKPATSYPTAAGQQLVDPPTLHHRRAA